MNISSKQLRGAAARNQGGDFEDRIGDSLEAYAEVGFAIMDFMPIPMTPCGQRHPKFGTPMYIPRGKAPFDVYGYMPRDAAVNVTAISKIAAPGVIPYAQVKLAVFVGAECKSSSERETSLPIVKPDKHAKGLAYHQLESLALVAKLGGIARVVWDNGGQVGVLKEAQIIHHHLIYSQSLAAELAGKKVIQGSRSIPADSFEPVDYARVGSKMVIDWLKIGGTDAAANN